MSINIIFGNNSKDLLDVFSAISPFLIGIITLAFYIWNSKQQKQQWLNDALIRNELNVLLQMKKLLSKNIVAINWYFTNVLSECIYENILEPKDFVEQIKIYHPQIMELYNFYRENYYIFEKYNLQNELKIIHFMMHMSKTIDEDEYRYVIIEKIVKLNMNVYRYKFMTDIQMQLEDWIAENRQDLLNAKKDCDYKCKDLCYQCSNTNVALNVMHKEMYWLIHKFDKATLSGNKESFDFEKEKDKIWAFEPYTELKNDAYNKIIK